MTKRESDPIPEGVPAVSKKKSAAGQINDENAAAYLAAIVESSEDAVISKDLSGVITSWNLGAEKIFGYPAGEMIGQPILRLIPPERLQEEAAILSRIRSGESVQHFETVRLAKDGSPIAVSVTVSAIRNSSGAIIGASKVARDISGSKRNEAARQQSEERYRTLFEYAPDGIVIANADAFYVDANARFCRMIGYSRDELVGMHSSMIVAESEIPNIAPALVAIKARADHNREWKFRRKDGSTFDAEVMATLLPDGDLLAMIRDVTEKKSLEAQFLRAQRMESIGTLAGGIAHDLNNILTPIMMSISILKDLSTEPDSIRILETIDVSAKRGADIVRQVLSFARGLEGERVEVQPKNLLRDLESIMRDTFPKDIRLQFLVPKDAWSILGDPTQVYQILLNLCVNARDSMPNGGNLTVSVENCVLDEHYAAMNIQAKPGHYVKINVTDSGTGIQPDILDKIFEPFFTTKELNKGTGLGLSTVMAIVKSHDGIINVYSEPGKGTTFKTYLPAIGISPETGKDPAQRAALPRGNGETILIVDDEASILTIAGQTLQAFGYRVLTATNGADALAVYVQNKAAVAAVLIDMMMPVMDGPSTIYALTRINPGIRIIAASGLHDNASAAKISEISQKHFLTKPYTAATLLKTIRAVLDQGRIPSRP